MIKIEHLTKRYQRHTAVDDLSFTASPGRITAFLGPNGAGKTTTLQVLAGLQHADDGCALIDDVPYRRLSRPLATVGVMLDAGALPKEQRPTDFLRWFALTNGIDASISSALLEEVGLADAEHRKIGTFSLGMKQRMALAAALLGDPGTLIMDEPANGLDPEGSRWLRQKVRHLADEGRTVLLSSHLLEEVSQIADDVVVIAAGRLLAETVPDTLIADVLGERMYVRSSDDAHLARDLRAQGYDVESDGDVLSVSAGQPDEVGVIAHRAGLVVYELGPRNGSLEDAFLAMTGPQQEERGDQ